MAVLQTVSFRLFGHVLLDEVEQQQLGFCEVKGELSPTKAW